MTQSPPIELYYRVPESVSTKAVLMRWEKFRIIYNAILAVPVIWITAMLHPMELAGAPFWVISIVAAIAANFCFCLGPFVDVWLFALGRFHRLTAVVLFALGMLVSFPLAVVAALTMKYTF